MAGRAKYSEADKAKVYVVLTANGSNIKRTARETGIPENTVRRWREEFKTNPPSTDVVQDEVDTFLNAAEETRDLALVTLTAKIPDAKPSELITIIGVLDDKITRAKGLATTRTEHVHTLPSPDEIGELLGGAIQSAIERAGDRQQEIIDAEVVDVRKALPQST